MYHLEPQYGMVHKVLLAPSVVWYKEPQLHPVSIMMHRAPLAQCNMVYRAPRPVLYRATKCNMVYRAPVALSAVWYTEHFYLWTGYLSRLASCFSLAAVLCCCM